MSKCWKARKTLAVPCNLKGLSHADQHTERDLNNTKTREQNMFARMAPFAGLFLGYVGIGLFEPLMAILHRSSCCSKYGSELGEEVLNRNLSAHVSVKPTGLQCESCSGMLLKPVA